MRPPLHDDDETHTAQSPLRRSHTAAPPLQCAFDVHSTQSCAESLQTGWAGVHAVRLVPLTALSLHSKHEPVTHAGRS